MDRSVELGDFVRIRRNGLSRIYLPVTPRSQSIMNQSKGWAYHLQYHSQPRDESAASRGATTSVRLMPGDTDIDAMFERWALSLTTGIDCAFTSVGGICFPEGSASRTRCRCRISIAVRRARRPSVKSNDDDGGDAEDGDAVNTRAAAAQSGLTRVVRRHARVSTGTVRSKGGSSVTRLRTTRSAVASLNPDSCARKRYR